MEDQHTGEVVSSGKGAEGIQAVEQPSEELVREALDEYNNREYLKERHQQAVNELKVSSNSAKPQLVMGLALAGVFVVIILLAQLF